MNAPDLGPPRKDEEELLTTLRHRLGWWPAQAPARVLARGGENTTIAVDGWIVRRNRDRHASTREVALLRAVSAASAVSVPVPLAHEVDLGALVYRQLPGTALHRRPGPARAVPGIVEVLRALRRCASELSLPVDASTPLEWRIEALADLAWIGAGLDDDRRSVVAGALVQPAPAPSPRPVPQHGDLGAEHLLVDEHGTLTGVLDWTDAAVADPAVDLGRLYRDLGPAVAWQVAVDLGDRPSGDDLARIRLRARCAWVEDRRYAAEDPLTRGAYLEQTDRTFEHTFLAES